MKKLLLLIVIVIIALLVMFPDALSGDSGNSVVSGLKDGVNSITNYIQGIFHSFTDKLMNTFSGLMGSLKGNAPSY